MGDKMMDQTNVTFDKSTERAIRALSRKSLFKNALLIFLFFAAAVGIYIAAAMREKSSFSDPMSILYLTIAVLPFYPFKLHLKFFTKTFYGKVTKREFAQETERNNYQFYTNRDDLHGEKVTVTFVSDDGEKKQEYTYNEPHIVSDAVYYDIGDRVFVTKGLKYPVKCPLPELVVCPMCGNFLGTGDRKCERCKNKF